MQHRFVSIPFIHHPTHLTLAEQRALGPDNFQLPGENVGHITFEDPVQMGKAVAHALLEWILQNPTGTLVLPTGQTPEYFIKALKDYKAHWSDRQAELKAAGIDSPTFPDTSGLHFVQLDEFLPIAGDHQKCFSKYVMEEYIATLGIPLNNVHLIDTAKYADVFKDGYKVETPEQREAQAEILAFCDAYEAQFQQLAQNGLFFVGGIGPDGHVGFNIQGTALSQKTHPGNFNRVCLAANAPSFGGISAAKTKGYITLGLASITEALTKHPNSRATIMVGGSTKAVVLAKAIEGPQTPDCPASALQGPKTRFYVTQNATGKLAVREIEAINRHDVDWLLAQKADSVLSRIALENNCTLLQLTQDILRKTPLGQAFLAKLGDRPLQDVLEASTVRFKAKIEAGFTAHQDGDRYVQTSPHTDDYELGMSPTLRQQGPVSNHAFVYGTGGFTSVTHAFMQDLIADINADFIARHAEKLNGWDRQAFCDHFVRVKDDGAEKRIIEQVWALKALMLAEGLFTTDTLMDRVTFYRDTYFPSRYAGQSDEKVVQNWKGHIRKWESDRMLALSEVKTEKVRHMDFEFYAGDRRFNPQPTQADVEAMVAQFREFRPTVVSATFDPEGSGPDTHHKVLQVVAEAVRVYNRDYGDPPIRDVLCYRNVWYWFDPAETTTAYCVTDADIQKSDDEFMACHLSQVAAECPSLTFDGPFSKQLVPQFSEQLRIMRTLLGNDYFDTHAKESVRTAKGLVFAVSKTPEAFTQDVASISARMLGGVSQATAVQ